MPSGNDNREDVERIKSRLPPVNEMAEQDGAELHKSGTEYRTDHPHHATSTSHPRTGNLCISAEGEQWHCKRHGHGGDKLDWVAMSEGIVSCSGLDGGSVPNSLFRDVLEVAADRVGVDLGDGPDRSADERARIERFDELRARLARFYHGNLDDHDKRGELKRRYGLSDEVIDENLVGYAPEAGMKHDLPAAIGVDADVLVRLGVLSDAGSPRFQDRFVFPYFESDRGERQVRYFTARAVEWNGERAKYLKLAKDDSVDELAQREPPFGIDTVRGARRVIVAEGVTDALVLHDNGYAAVSPVTTHISGDALDDFADRLRGKDVTVVYDHDAGTNAGIEGAARDAWSLKEKGVDAEVARLPAKPNESVDVAEFFLRESEPAERFESEVVDGMTFPAEAAHWAWGGGDHHHLFAAAVEHLGHDPSMAAKRKNDDGETYWISVEKLVGDVDSLAKARRRFYADGKTNWSGGDHKEAYHWVIRWVFESEGEFFKTDAGSVHYYHDPSNRVVDVTTESDPTNVNHEFGGLIADRLGITTAEWSSHLYKTVGQSVAKGARERPTARVFHFDEEEGELYVSDFDGHYYALNGDSVDRRRNGTDVFFLDVRDAEPWTYIDSADRSNVPNEVPGERAPFTGRGDLVHRLLCNRVNFDEKANLGPSLQRSQLYIHLHAMAFGSVFNGRPIMAWVGQKGSGKTVVLRSIGRWMYGPEWTESTMQEQQDDFVAKVSGKTLAAIDNYDDGVDWANDMLASIATGTSIEKRELYTTNELRQVNPDCFLAITSRDPPFRRDDVADRCLVFRLDRVSGEFIGETSYLKQPVVYRDDLWSDYVDNLNAILRVRRERDNQYRETTHRMADWAIFARDAAEALDVNGVDELLDGMKTERAYFALEDDPLRLVIESWLESNPGGGAFETGELINPFEQIAKKENIAFQYSTGRGLAQGLTAMSDELNELFGMEIETTRSGSNQYRFPGGRARYNLGEGSDGGGQ